MKMDTDSEQHIESSFASEELVCFVCGVPVCGKFYPLATCRLLCTKTPIIEKMSQLVGESYMVVITEDDVVCRSCANLMNTLDRLEAELGSVRNVVLRFLEKKYELSDGELVNSKPIEVGQPPQITPGQGKLEQYSRKENYMARKRRQVPDIKKEKENGSGDGTKHKSSSKNIGSLMQCDKCKYTTSFNAFMIHHIRQHVKRKTVCDYCGANIEHPGGACPQKCNGSSGDVGSAHSLPKDQVSRNQDCQKVAKAAVQSRGLASGELKSVSVMGNSNGVVNGSNEEVTIQVSKISQPTVMHQSVGSAGGGESSTLCVMSNGSTLEQPQLMEVQKMEDEDSNAVYVQVVDVGKGNETDETGNLRKQVLTVADDGTVEMVEVLWDEMITPDIEVEQNYLQQ